jgi:hypothetical protein
MYAIEASKRHRDKLKLPFGMSAGSLRKVGPVRFSRGSGLQKRT